MGKIGFFSSWARRRAISRQAATRSACTSRSRETRSSSVMAAKARASSPTSSGASRATGPSRSPAPTPRARAASARTGRAIRPDSTSAVASAASSAREATPTVRRRTPPVTSASSVCGIATTTQSAEARGSAAQRYTLPPKSSVPSRREGPKGTSASEANGDDAGVIHWERAMSRSATSVPISADSSPSRPASSGYPPRTTTGVPAQLPGREAITARRSTEP